MFNEIALIGLVKKCGLILMITCFSLTNVQADTPFWAKYIPNGIRQYIAGLPSDKNTTVFGPASYSNVNLTSLEVMGPTSLTSVNIEGQTSIQGPLNARDSKLKNLEVNGPVYMQATTITGQTTINGPLFIMTPKN